MLNNKKVEAMTKLAIYEKNEGKEDLKMSKYFKTDYVRLHVLKTVVSVTIGYLLVILMIGAYKSEYLINEAVTLNYKLIGTYILGAYIMLIAVSIFGTIIGYSLKFDSSRKRLGNYYKNLKILRKIYQQEELEQK